MSEETKAIIDILETYWKKGGFYEIPTGIINDVKGELEEQDKEIERLNNIINEIDNYFFSQLQLYGGGGIVQEYYNKIQELKGCDK